MLIILLAGCLLVTPANLFRLLHFCAFYGWSV